MKKLFRAIFAPFVLVAALLLVPAAAQAQTLDQSQTSWNPSTSLQFAGSFLPGQTFTAGVSGNLAQVDLALLKHGSPSGNLTVGIYATAGGVPSGSALGTGSVSASSLTTTSVTWVSVAISPAVPIVAGSQYAIVLSDPSDLTSGASGYNAAVAISDPAAGGTDPYAGGMLVASTDGGVTWLQGDSSAGFLIDLAFRTYVTTNSQDGQGQNNNGQGQNNNNQGPKKH